MPCWYGDPARVSCDSPNTTEHHDAALRAQDAAITEGSAYSRWPLGAAALSLKALALAQTLGEDATMTGANTHMHVGLLACSLGRYTEAVAELERCRADLTVLQLPRLLATAQNHLAWLWTVLGQPQRALQMPESATGGLPHVHRVRRWTIRAEMQRLCGASPAGPTPRWFWRVSCQPRPVTSGWKRLNAGSKNAKWSARPC